MAKNKPVRVRPGGVSFTDEWSAAQVAERERDPIHRCDSMILNLTAVRGELERESLSPELRKRRTALVDRMWNGFMSQRVDREGQMPVSDDVRKLRDILEVVSQARESGGERHAREVFAGLLTDKLPARCAHINPITLSFVDECAALWRLRAGRPTKKSKASGRRSKWEAFAALHEALGYGPIDPEQLRKSV